MSTIKSQTEHLTLNADGTGKEIKFQCNGTEVAKITSAGLSKGNAVAPMYYEQSAEPTEATSGDLWRDTDTNVIASLYVDGSTRIWMEI